MLRRQLEAVSGPQPVGQVGEQVIEDLLARGVDSPSTLAESPTARLLADAELLAHDRELRFLRNATTPAAMPVWMARNTPDR